MADTKTNETRNREVNSLYYNVFKRKKILISLFLSEIVEIEETQQLSFIDFIIYSKNCKNLKILLS